MSSDERFGELTPTDEGKLLSAAQYMRMSTEHQKYSIDNQRAAINDYAKLHGLRIVRSYVDAGKSGLTIDRRDALKRLIADVHSGAVDFRYILVFDVSRWGRFQDIDEGAFYEFMCRRAGLTIKYCGEPFENDGTLVGSLLKSIKRLMAAEYSRELSSKIFAAQVHCINLGFKAGGTACFGLRRALVDQDKNIKLELAFGQTKQLRSDRVIIVLGPENETNIVREVFDLFVNQRKRQADIARILNARGVTNSMGRPWRAAAVRDLLRNPLYIGEAVYNRVSFKLKKQLVRNHPDAWVRAPSALPPIVDAGLFQKAQQIIAGAKKHLPDEQLIARLRTLYEKHGRLSVQLIDECEATPCSLTYLSRFGSMGNAYRLAGYTGGRPPQKDNPNRGLSLNKRVLLIKRICELLRRDGIRAEAKPRGGAIVVDGRTEISVRVSCCQRRKTGLICWELKPSGSPLTVAARIAESGTEILDYYVLPKAVTGINLRLASSFRCRWDAHRAASLEGVAVQLKGQLASLRPG